MLEHVWRCLAEGASDRRSAYHCPTLATVDEAGRPTMRTVVLRQADAATRQILVHTRVDAAKVGQIRRTGRAALHCYDGPGKRQITVDASATVETAGELVDARWRATSHGSRACYRRVTPSAAEAPWPENDVDPEDEAARGRFAVVVLRADRVESLELHHAGHRRWRCDWTGCCWNFRRIAP